MTSRINILIEKLDSGYIAKFPETEEQQIYGESLDIVVNQLKPIIEDHLTQEENQPVTTGQSLLQLFESITEGMTAEAIQELPTDGAEQHDHYIYGSPKRNS
jgi:predicted RNase H-like HicB family nuclease